MFFVIFLLYFYGTAAELYQNSGKISRPFCIFSAIMLIVSIMLALGIDIKSPSAYIERLIRSLFMLKGGAI